MSHDTVQLDWSPSPQLAVATREALGVFARRWPKYFAWVHSRSRDAQDGIVDFAFALREVDPRVLVPAARVWIADNGLPPQPAEFRRVAESVARQAFPAPPAAPVALPLPADRLPGVTDAQFRRGMQVLGRTVRVMRAIAIVVAREGHAPISDAAFDDAVAWVQQHEPDDDPVIPTADMREFFADAVPRTHRTAPLAPPAPPPATPVGAVVRRVIPRRP